MKINQIAKLIKVVKEIQEEAKPVSRQLKIQKMVKTLSAKFKGVHVSIDRGCRKYPHDIDITTRYSIYVRGVAILQNIECFKDLEDEYERLINTPILADMQED